MRVIWMRFAIESLKDIHDFYHKIAGPKVALKIRKDIVSEAKKINPHPYLGQKQESLSVLHLEHRYFIKGHFKIIYRISNDEIIITDIFDTRQHPSKMNNDSRKL